MVFRDDQTGLSATNRYKDIRFFEKLLKIVHPFTPFITEEIWHWLRERNEGEDIIISKWPEVKGHDEKILNQFDAAAEIITGIRNIRKQNNIANKVNLDLSIKNNGEHDSTFDAVLIKMGNLSQLAYTTEKIPNAYSFIAQNSEFFIPFGDDIDLEAERKKLEEELVYAEGSLNIVRKKLSNERFVNNAPEAVVASERKKESDALSKIQILTEKLATLAE